MTAVLFAIHLDSQLVGWQQKIQIDTKTGNVNFLSEGSQGKELLEQGPGIQVRPGLVSGCLVYLAAQVDIKGATVQTNNLHCWTSSDSLTMEPVSRLTI